MDDNGLSICWNIVYVLLDILQEHIDNGGFARSPGAEQPDYNALLVLIAENSLSKGLGKGGTTEDIRRVTIGWGGRF